MPNFFIKSTFAEADFLIRKPLHSITEKLHGPVAELRDHTSGTMAHFFAKNPKTEFMLDKLNYLWDNGVKKEEADSYGKYAVEYLISYLEKKIKFVEEYNGIFDEARINSYTGRSFGHMGEKEVLCIKNILDCIGSMLPQYECMQKKGIDVRMKQVSELLNNVVKFEEKYYGFIIEQQTSKKEIENVLVPDEPLLSSKPKKRL